MHADNVKLNENDIDNFMDYYSMKIMYLIKENNRKRAHLTKKKIERDKTVPQVVIVCLLILV